MISRDKMEFCVRLVFLRRESDQMGTEQEKEDKERRRASECGDAG